MYSCYLLGSRLGFALEPVFLRILNLKPHVDHDQLSEPRGKIPEPLHAARYQNCEFIVFQIYIVINYLKSRKQATVLTLV